MAEEARSAEGLDGFLATEGRHWTEQISRTGLKDAARRAEIIARTEVQRAMMAAALWAYREAGVSYKHLLLAPDDECDICAEAAADGVIPLDAVFSPGETAPPFHPNCRCGIAPAGVEVIPPQGHLGKSDKGAGEREREVNAFLLLRTRNAEGKKRYLIQKRGDEMNHPGVWGLPGGGAHPGETPWQAAVREATEEAGKLPELEPVLTVTQITDDSDCYTFLCDVPWFEPEGGSTPEEVAGWGWFSRKEIGELELQPNFEEAWDYLCSESAEKARKRSILVSGQEIYPVDSENDEEFPPSGGGGRYPHPHDAEGAEVAPGGRPGAEPPRWDGDEAPPYVEVPAGPGGAPGISAGRTGTSRGGGTDFDVTDGSVMTRRPDDDEDDEEPNGQAVSAGFVRGRPPNAVGKGADEAWDPNPVEGRHVYNMMLANFPAKALGWVLRTHWIGPVEIPWERVNTASEEEWAASHEPEKVEDFRKQIVRGEDVHPSILVQPVGSGKCDIVDGHHRALARRELGKPVLAYVGFVHGKDLQDALETHSSQVHHGSDPRNR